MIESLSDCEREELNLFGILVSFELKKSLVPDTSHDTSEPSFHRDLARGL